MGNFHPNSPRLPNFAMEPNPRPKLQSPPNGVNSPGTNVDNPVDTGNLWVYNVAEVFRR